MSNAPRATSDHRERIAIVGGGIGSLTAAYQLSRTPALRRRYRLTIYQMGWRLGGKLASGRNIDEGYRNEEHGLHVWFGFYENAFALARELYDRWVKPNGCPFDTWEDAFTPQLFTPFGQRINGQYEVWDFRWPANDDTPGDGHVLPSVWGVISEFLHLIELVINELIDSFGLASDVHFDFLPDIVENVLSSIADSLNPTHAVAHQLAAFAERAAKLAASLDDRDGDGVADSVESVAEALIWLIEQIQSLLDEVFDGVTAQTVDQYHLLSVLEVGLAFVRGVLNPDYDILADGNFDRIDHLEFREWLMANGCTEVVAKDWVGIRALYDAAFQYRDGDHGEPSFAAGCAARTAIRIVFTYKGSVLWLITAGMGEVLIGPLYEVLRDQGVEFEFFHKLDHIGLSPDASVAQTLRFERQALTHDGPYRPVFEYKGLVSWPSEPLWDQLVDGPALKAAGVDFESHWNAHPVPETVTLTQGVDFDRCVLGVSMGAFKVLNSEDTSLAAEIIAAKPEFKAMTEGIEIVPSVSCQLWLDDTTEELGWTQGRAAMVSWAYPMDVWADMSEVLVHEGWGYDEPPKSSFYFCGTMATTAFRQPRSAVTTPAAALAQVHAETHTQFTSYTASIWPNAVDPADSQTLDWSLLHAPDSLSGPDRLYHQWFKANIDPTECCVASFADTTKYRLRSDESGVVNLFLCGTWIRTGLNLTCVEGGVMSGMQAARAISGSPHDIVGEDFLGPSAFDS